MVYGECPFAYIRETFAKMSAIQNPKHTINYRSTVAPLNKKGESIKELAVTVEQEVIDTIKSCLTFDQRKRETIPRLLKDSFLTMVGKSTSISLSCSYGDLIVPLILASSSPPPPPPQPLIDDRTMALIVQRVVKATKSEPLQEADARSLVRVSLNHSLAARSLSESDDAFMLETHDGTSRTLIHVYSLFFSSFPYYLLYYFHFFFL